MKIDGLARWRATSDVARRFQDGRIFLAGDAAHLMPPNGGFGGNTGIHDAHNLAWKLALVLKGVAEPAPARRPTRPSASRSAKFTVEQAYTRYVTRTAPYLGAKDFQPPAHDFNIELGYLYHSPAIVPEGDDKIHDDPRQTFGRTGSRAPHLWLERAAPVARTERRAALDPRPVRPRIRAARGAGRRGMVRSRRERPPRRFRDWNSTRITSADRSCATRAGASRRPTASRPRGAVLVRPDGFVAWRAKEKSNGAAGRVDRSAAHRADEILMTTLMTTR